MSARAGRVGTRTATEPRTETRMRMRTGLGTGRIVSCETIVSRRLTLRHAHAQDRFREAGPPERVDRDPAHRSFQPTGRGRPLVSRRLEGRGARALDGGQSFAPPIFAAPEGAVMLSLESARSD